MTFLPAEIFQTQLMSKIELLDQIEDSSDYSTKNSKHFFFVGEKKSSVSEIIICLREDSTQHSVYLVKSSQIGFISDFISANF